MVGGVILGGSTTVFGGLEGAVASGVAADAHGALPGFDVALCGFVMAGGGGFGDVFPPFFVALLGATVGEAKLSRDGALSSLAASSAFVVVLALVAWCEPQAELTVGTVMGVPPRDSSDG